MMKTKIQLLLWRLEVKMTDTTAIEQFPDFDGLVVRIGETHLNDVPYYQGHINYKSNQGKTIIPLMQIIREEICVKREKQLIFRTWRAFDVHAKHYQEVSDAVEPHPNLVMLHQA